MDKKKLEVLRLFKKALEAQQNIKHFSPQWASKKLEKVRSGVKLFLKEPNFKNYENFWNKLHAAMIKAKAKFVWEHNPEERVKNIVKEISEADEFDNDWVKKIEGAKKILWELYGSLHIEKTPLLNGCDLTGLKFFGFKPSGDYNSVRGQFEKFKKEIYLKEVGYGTEGTDQEVPLNLEIDQLFNLIDKIKEKDVEGEFNDLVKDLYESILFFKRDPDVWAISPEEEAELWPDWKEKNIITIGWDELGDLSNLTKEEIFKQLKEKKEKEGNKKKPMNTLRSCQYFANEIDSGDIVIVKKGGHKDIFGIGIVKGNYHYDDSRERHKHTRKVEYLLKTKDKETLNLPKLNKKFVQITVYKYSKNFDDFVEVLKNSELNREKVSLKEGLDIGNAKNPKEKRLFQAFLPKSYWWFGVNSSPTDTGHYDKSKWDELREDGTALWACGKQRGSYYDEMKVGDKVLGYLGSPERKLILEAEISREKFTKDDTYCIELRFLRNIDINWDTIKNRIPENNAVTSNVSGTIFKMTEDEYRNLLGEKSDISAEKNILAEVFDSHPITVDFDDISLSDKDMPLHFRNSDRLFKTIESALKMGQHIILLGPPGTGKSKLAKEICKQYRSEGNYRMVTANSDWSTFDTVGGYRPDKEGTIYFDEGLFLECFKDKNTMAHQNKWLILDEINRADIDKAFGAIYSALTGDEVSLSFEAVDDKNIVIRSQQDDEDTIKNTNHEFVIPKDWRIIATMNTFDKASLYEMSYAFMRRFAFIQVPVPKLNNINKRLLEKYLSCWDEVSGEEVNIEHIVELWKAVNKTRKIGPAIVEDICKFISDCGDYSDAICMYVLPQFEGLLEVKQANFIKELKKLDFIKHLEELERSASDFWGLDKEKFDISEKE